MKRRRTSATGIGNPWRAPTMRGFRSDIHQLVIRPLSMTNAATHLALGEPYGTSVGWRREPSGHSAGSTLHAESLVDHMLTEHIVARTDGRARMLLAFAGAP